MANGRLGKQKVAAKVTAEIYKNTSGAEASVSVVGQSTLGTGLYLHIDDGSDALTTSSTLATEAYNARYVDYSAGNTALPDPAATYAGRFSFFDTTTTTTYGFDTQFEAYVNSNTTTYTFQSQTEYFMTSNTFMPYETWKNVRADAVRMQTLGTASFSRIYNWDETVDEVSEEDYYNRVINGDYTGSSNSQSLSYYDRGAAVDPWATERMYSLSVGSSGSLYATMQKPTDTGFGANGVSSTTSWYNQYVNSGPSATSATYNYRYLHLQKEVAVGEGCGAENRIAINVFGDAFHDSSQTAATMARDMVHESYKKLIQWNLGGTTRRGGQVVYFQYNPSDALHYLCYYDTNTSQMYLAALNASTAVETIANNSVVSMAAGGAQGDAYGLVHTDLSLTVASPFEFSLNQDNSARCTFIGTTASPLWALVFMRYNDNTSSHTYYSTDLKTWQRSTDYFGSVDYTKVTQDTTITSNGGVVTGVKSNILNVGTDGVLEQGTSFSQYERTGLVLSNNDRVIVYNSGSNECVVQVMGYEGV